MLVNSGVREPVLQKFEYHQNLKVLFTW